VFTGLHSASAVPLALAEPLPDALAEPLAELPSPLRSRTSPPSSEPHATTIRDKARAREKKVLPTMPFFGEFTRVLFV